ncbi:efflux RND transporter periplasmic adaptor subunit [bacterium]|nr:MAG: efflux RND transporter periplasmic adaptor subunit [bacterium]
MMAFTRILKVSAALVLVLAIFGAGYFWGLRSKNGSPFASGRSTSAETKDTRGMENMPGMEGMAPGTVMVSPDKQQLLGVRTASVEKRPMTRIVRTVGTITYDETKLTRVHSKSEGWVEKLYVNYTGKLVEKGQPLFSIYSPDLLATQMEYLLALKNQAQFASSSIPEVKAGAASLVEASKKRLMLWDISEKQIRDLGERGEPQKTLTLYAPHSGFVIKKDVNEGMKIMPDRELYTIADLSTVWVNMDVYESEIPSIGVGQRATISLSYYPEQVFTGKVSYVYPYLDEKTRTIKVRLEFPNPGFRLKPDMYVNAEIKIDSGRHLAVPEEAVLDSGLRKIVFLDKGDGHFEPKEVKLGAKMDGFYQILSGLKEGEKVAASSVFLLDSESRLSEAMGAMAGMPGMEEMKMDAPAKQGPLEKKVQNLTITLSTQPAKPKAGENILRLKITDQTGKPVKDAQVSFQYTMTMQGMVPSKTEAKLSKDGFYEAKTNLAMVGEWEVTVVVRRSGQKEVQEKFKVVTHSEETK